MGTQRIDACFAALKAENRAALIAYICAGDPSTEVSNQILKGLPEAGADIIELGMPFSDPMADGPSVQAASLRALQAGMTLHGTLAQVRGFRKNNTATPIILMGYFNPIFSYGVERFAKDADEAGVDGLIVVDLPPEEEDELKPHTDGVGLSLIRLVAPTTDDARMARVTQGTSGFVYYVSITGVTGTKSFTADDIIPHLIRITNATKLPIAVGFGIRTSALAAEVARLADAAVVGSAIVDHIRDSLDETGAARESLVGNVLGFVSELSNAVRSAR